MSFVLATIYIHVVAGSLWTLVSLVIAVTRYGSRPLVAAQMVAALVAVAAGITLWHALHAAPFGSIEHLLIVGTFCAFIALGLQLGVVVPALQGAAPTRFAGGSLVLIRVSAVFLVLAALTMVGSLYA